MGKDPFSFSGMFKNVPNAADFLKPFAAQIPTFPIDAKDFMDNIRRNWQAFAQAHQMATDSLQVIIRQQNQMMTALAEKNGAALRETMTPGEPADKMACSLMVLRENYENILDQMKELTDLALHSSQETADVLHKRISENLNELSDAMGRMKNKRDI